MRRSCAAGSSLVGLSEDGSSRLYPIELSGGMKQRVVMVVSTLLDPSLLIADEITSALDVSTQKAVAEMLVEFRDRGFVKSTIVITHDLSILYQIADTILVMYAGSSPRRRRRSRSSRRRGTRTRGLLIARCRRSASATRSERLAGIAGRPPSLLDPPDGCRFRDRCPLASERCAEQPPLLLVGDGHAVACWAAAPAAAARPPGVASVEAR